VLDPDVMSLVNPITVLITAVKRFIDSFMIVMCLYYIPLITATGLHPDAMSLIYPYTVLITAVKRFIDSFMIVMCL
jgi:hypothetical protein